MEPFRIEVPDAAIADLRERLGHTRWPLDPASLGWDRGAPLHHVRALAERWRDGYDWRTWEARLNAWPQLLTEIDGTPIHAAHVRSPEPDALPLVLSHGWPGSIAEFLDVVGPLTDPRAHGGDPADAFHVVAPSLPGFGFSGPAPTTGWAPRRIGEAFGVLMERLGYDRYGAQGGDWGSAISRWIGATYPERVVGVHVNMLSGALPKEDDGTLSEDERARLAQAQGVLARRLRLLRAAVDPASDVGVRADGLACGPARVAGGEVRGVDRRGGRGRCGADPGEHLLVHADSGVVRADLPRARARG